MNLQDMLGEHTKIVSIQLLEEIKEELENMREGRNSATSYGIELSISAIDKHIADLRNL